MFLSNQIKYMEDIMAVWDPIWANDSYSDVGLRRIKTQYKVKNFLTHLDLKEGNLCIDLGCGGGYISAEIAKRSGCKVVGFDVSEVAINCAKKNNVSNNNEFYVASVENLPLPDICADVVLCVGVLEHIKNLDKALGEILRILKPHGKIIIITSNWFSCMYFDRLLKQLVAKWKYGYQKNWTPRGLRKKLQSHGINIIDITIYQGIGDFNTKNYIDSKIHKIFNNWGRYIQFVGELKK